jgi:small subunit ribosomal protein S13
VSSEFKHLVRLHGTTLDGARTIPHALRGIKGVGMRLAYAIVRLAGLDPTRRLGDLSEAEVKRLEDILKDPSGLPPWMLNRRRDPQTGRDLHLTGSDLDLRVREDIELMKEIRSWKGDRHMRGLKVRGQKTRTTGRKGRAVGVSKKSQAQK